MNKDIIGASFEEVIVLYKYLQNDKGLKSQLLEAKDMIVNSFKKGKSVFLCGNGGSAADAQHLAAELSGKYKLERKALPCEALQVNTSFVTAVANDYSFDYIFERAVEAFCREGDVLIALSTSGNSNNIIKGIAKAKELNVHVIGMTGEDGGMMKDLCTHLFKIPSHNTPRIQEAHLFIGHILCEIVEQELFGND